MVRMIAHRGLREGGQIMVDVSGHDFSPLQPQRKKGFVATRGASGGLLSVGEVSKGRI